MDIIVCLKQVVDLQQVRIKKDTREPVTEGLPFLFGDMDRNALEEAVKIKEKSGGKVIALSLGSPKLRDTIKDALAVGADEAVILIDPLFDNLDSMGKAQVLMKAIQKIGKYDLILLGEGSADSYSGQTGPRLAELLDLPVITYVKQIEFADNKVKAVRSVEECFEVVEAQLPAVITITSGINEPRIPSLTQILRASRKPLQEWKSSNIGVTADEVGGQQIKMLSNLAPVEQRKLVILEGDSDQNIDSLVNSLLKEGVLGG
ncbi:MAG: electron transfer flavoprotein subunit beta/FixA family protein [Chloroflexota bacterium]